MTAQSKKVIILGGGPAGIAGALTVKARGGSPVLIEQSDALGGKARSFACKASSRCLLCGACMVDTKIDEVRRGGIDIRFNTALREVEFTDNGLRAVLSDNTQFEAGGLLLATGYDNYDPSVSIEYGYGVHPDIITGYDCEELVRREGRLLKPSDGKVPARTAFIQCVGSREHSACGNYCAEVCCKYALRLAALLKKQQPAMAVTVFYIDIQQNEKDFRAFYQEHREHFRFIHGRPVFCAGMGEAATFKYKDESTGRMTWEEFDLTILATGIKAAAGNASLAETLNLPADGSGFLQSRGCVQVAGTASGPMGIAASFRSGETAARALLQG